ncbi:hypothetical protein ACJX0J_034665, partial [Zea mays]
VWMMESTLNILVIFLYINNLINKLIVSGMLLLISLLLKIVRQYLSLIVNLVSLYHGGSMDRSDESIELTDWVYMDFLLLNLTPRTKFAIVGLHNGHSHTT